MGYTKCVMLTWQSGMSVSFPLFFYIDIASIKKNVEMAQPIIFFISVQSGEVREWNKAYIQMFK